MTRAVPAPAPAAGHALVVGGGIAGLLAARVLAEQVGRVTLVERDRLPDGPWPRPGVPQSHHLHVLLPHGRDLFEAWFPGLADELGAAGAPLQDGAADLAWRTAAGWGIRFRSTLVSRVASRPLLEWTIRRRVAALANVDLQDGREVIGLTATADGGRITGARVRARAGTGELQAVRPIWSSTPAAGARARRRASGSTGTASTSSRCRPAGAVVAPS